MSPHLPDDILRNFVLGDVGEQLAVHIATHLDDCPACATRAAGMEPLAAVFASIQDPLPPEGLAAAVLASADAPRPARPLLEVAVGAGLLASGLLLFVGLDGPVASLNSVSASLAALGVVGRGLGAALSSFQGVLVVSTLLAAAGAFASLHFGALQRPSLPMWRSS